MKDFLQKRRTINQLRVFNKIREVVFIQLFNEIFYFSPCHYSAPALPSGRLDAESTNRNSLVIILRKE